MKLGETSHWQNWYLLETQNFLMKGKTEQQNKPLSRKEQSSLDYQVRIEAITETNVIERWQDQ